MHGLWRDNANAEEGDETDEPAMSPFSPPGIKICSEIKTPLKQPRTVPSAGSFLARESTHVTIAEPGKRCNQCQARETMQSVRSAGKPLIRVENWSLAGAGKHATRA